MLVFSSLETFSEKGAALPAQCSEKRETSTLPSAIEVSFYSETQSGRTAKATATFLTSKREPLSLCFTHSGQGGLFQVNLHTSVFLETGHEFLKKTFRSSASCSRIMRDPQGPAAPSSCLSCPHSCEDVSGRRTGESEEALESNFI